MKPELTECLSLLKCEGYTVVLKKDDKRLTSRFRGVKPLLDLLDEYGSLKGFYAADKVVGKAAAYVYSLLGIKGLYALTISDGACDVLEKHGIEYFYESRVPVIRNRTDTDSCPMEKATANADTPEEAIALIRETLKKLNSKQNEAYR